MLELDDIQHFLLTRPPASAARYVFLSFKDVAAGRHWLQGLIDKVGRGSSVRVKNFYAGLNQLEQLGAPELRFTIEEDMGHDVWARVYAGRDVYDWLLAHTKQPAPAASK